MAISHGESWHVRASIGTELGPIDTDTLLTMAESGLLCDADVVRNATDSDWQPLPIVLDGLRSTQPAAKTSPTAPHGNPANRVSAVKPVATVKLPPRIADQSPVNSEIVDRESVANREQKSSGRPRPLPGWQEPSRATAGRSSSKSESLKPSREELQIPPADVESNPSSLDDWKKQRRQTIDRLLAKVAEREAAAVIESDVSVEARDETSLDFVEPLPRDGSDAATDPSETIKQESFTEMRDRWRRSLPSWPVVIGFVLIVGLAIMYWPTSISQSRTVARFHAMYVKLERHRIHPLDRTGMDDFSHDAVAELKLLIPKLQERAGDRDQDSKVLLWMARDCLLPILKTPRNRDTKPERDLLMLFAAWDKRHQTTYAVMPDPETE